MLLLRKKSSPRSINFGNEGAARKSLSRLGATVTSSANARRFHNRKWIACSANSLRFSVYDSTGQSGLLVEDEQTNLCTYSSEDHASWGVFNATKAASLSCIDGKAGFKLTGSATNGQAGKNVGVFSGNPEVFYVIMESGDSATADISIYNATAANHALRVRLTFATGAVTTVTQTGTGPASGSINLGAGPNGGTLWLLWAKVTSTTGNTRGMYFYSSTTTLGKYTYFHHAQYVAGEAVTSPIVTTAASATRSADLITFGLPSWLSDTGFAAASRHNSFSDNSAGLQIGFIALTDADNLFYTGALLSQPVAKLTHTAGTVDETVSINEPDDYSCKVAANFNSSTLKASSAGTSGSAATGSTPTMDTVYIGSGAGVLSINGHMLSLKLMPTVVSDDALASLGA